MTTHSRSPPALRCEALRDALLSTAEQDASFTLRIGGPRPHEHRRVPDRLSSLGRRATASSARLRRQLACRMRPGPTHASRATDRFPRWSMIRRAPSGSQQFFSGTRPAACLPAPVFRGSLSPSGAAAGASPPELPLPAARRRSATAQGGAGSSGAPVPSQRGQRGAKTQSALVGDQGAFVHTCAGEQTTSSRLGYKTRMDAPGGMFSSFHQPPARRDPT